MALYRSILNTKGYMKSTLSKNIALCSFPVILLMFFTCCQSPSSPEWEHKNKELINQYDLKERQLSVLPKTTTGSNLEAGKVRSLDSLAVLTLHPGVTAKIFWGTGNMVSTLQLEPNAKIPEEVLPADRFL